MPAVRFAWFLTKRTNISNMKKSKPTQKSMLLEHLRRFGSIEPLTALREYGIYRLSAVIFKLKHDGHNIVTERISAISRITGQPVHFANYIYKPTLEPAMDAPATTPPPSMG